MKPRIYLDTSAIGGYYDEEFALWSRQLIYEIRQGLKIAIISDLTLLELEGAPQNVKDILPSIPPENLENVVLGQEAENLAQNYILSRVVTETHIADAQHIAVATVERVDVLVSWNFKQILNLNRIHLFNSVNLKLGYPILEIRSPREVINEKKI